MDPIHKFSILKEAAGTFSGLIWPVALIVAMLLLTRLFPGIKQSQKAGRLWPKKRPLSSELDALEDLAAKILAEAGMTNGRITADREAITSNNDRLRSVLEDAKSDPGLAVLRLSALLNEEVRALSGRINSRASERTRGRAPNVGKQIEFACPGITHALDLFSAIGGKIQKQRKDDDETDARRCLNAGMTLYAALKNLHCENA